ncbi:MAG: TetR/AcrR family transcriptional regulator C-terminal domain-containing protein [Gordonia sp. (in: high G+C Gram-positive bacteria)]
MTEGEQDARRIVDLLWGSGAEPRPGPRQRTSVAEVVDAAIALADADGLAGVSMRALATAVGLRPMGLYTYVPNREVLIALMVDAVAARDDDFPVGLELADCLRAVAGRYRADVLEHPWLLDVPAWRPVPGPGSTRRFEQHLIAISEAAERRGCTLGDVELDAVVAVLRDFAIGNARSRVDQLATYAESGMTDAQWWEVVGPALAEAMPEGRYPVSSRVGNAVGELFEGPGNADHAYEYGLDRLVAGILADLAVMDDRAR